MVLTASRPGEIMDTQDYEEYLALRSLIRKQELELFTAQTEVDIEARRFHSQVLPFTADLI